jgi:hypothetical protein
MDPATWVVIRGDACDLCFKLERVSVALVTLAGVYSHVCRKFLPGIAERCGSIAVRLIQYWTSSRSGELTIVGRLIVHVSLGDATA